jgi:hypothetical protein
MKMAMTMTNNLYKIDGDTLIFYNKKDNRELLFDVEDFDLIYTSAWYIHTNKKNGYEVVKASSGNLRGKSAHRVLMNFPKNKLVDHMNGNTLDNRKSNLRITTSKVNSQNNPKAKGYYWNKQMKRWHVQIAVNGKNKHIGQYVDETEARAAYLKAKQIYHPSAPTHLWQQL